MRTHSGRTARPWRALSAWAGRLLALAALIALPGLAGCGGGTGGGGNTVLNAKTGGQVLIGLTDADGDFLSYQVNVLSLKLTRGDGTTVETLPATTPVDFSQYTAVTEFLTAATVPVGTYTSAVLRLDFTGADIRVEQDVGGTPTAVPVTPVDGNGDPLGVAEVTVQLTHNRPIKVVPGLPAQLVLDFDLAASNVVDLTNQTVTVKPILLADVNPTDTKPHRLRGLLKSVEVQAHLFQMRVLPFALLRPARPVPPEPLLAAAFKDGLADADHDGFPDATDGLRDDNHDGVLDHRDGYGFGVFPVKTDADTAFEINGVPYTGDDGLKALALLPAGTPVVALGDVNRAGRHMRATQVRAGSSVAWADKDVVAGVVTAREGNTLTVKGAVLTFRNGLTAYRDEATVLVGPDTRVTRLDTDPALLDEAAISVGQRILAMGELLPTMDPASTDTTLKDMPVGILPSSVLDARSGAVRLLLTTLTGQVVSVEPGLLVVDLWSLGGRDAALFDFTGTGGLPEDDADPAAYEIDTGTLDLGFVTEGTGVQVRGFVRPFGAAGAELRDFEARTVVSRSLTVDGPALLDLTWAPPTAEPFTEASADGVTPSLTGVGERHHLVQRWHVADLLDLPGPPRIVPPADGRGTFAVALPESLHIYYTFAGFVEAVAAFGGDGQEATRLVAHGEWDAETSTLTSPALSLQMTPAVSPG